MVMRYKVQVFHFVYFFFFNDTATTEIYTLSPTRRSSDLVRRLDKQLSQVKIKEAQAEVASALSNVDRKSTRLNSSLGYSSYAVFCLKKKKMQKNADTRTNRTNSTRYGNTKR